MSKKLIVMLIVAGFLTSALFANGSKESPTAGQAPMAGRGGQSFSGDLITLSGSLILEENEVPKIKSGTDIYGLMYPHYLENDFQVEDGQEITVEGYEAPGPGWESSIKYLMVIKATIGEKVYEFFHGRMGNRSMGPGCGFDDENLQRAERRGFGHMRGGRGRR